MHGATIKIGECCMGKQSLLMLRIVREHIKRSVDKMQTFLMLNFALRVLTMRLRG
jgi:hypothetical protein